ncbi:MAG: hypothetical protein KC619_30840 [Myxococcales bacterium]|nr:hypothetical protein [Myxococcales bacterium]
MSARWLTLGALLLSTGCYARHGATEARDAGVIPDAGCVGDRPICVRPTSPCGARVVVAPECDGSSWRCPADAFEHARASGSTAGCSPVTTGLDALGSLGLAVEDGDRCLWILDEAAVGDRVVPDPAVVAMDTPFGTCDGALPFLDDRATRPVVTRRLPEGWSVSLLDDVVVDGTTWIFHRLYAPDPEELYGYRELGTGAAPWDPRAHRLLIEDRVVGTIDGFTYGDAAITFEGEAYVFGCRGPVDVLRTECRLARAIDPGEPSTWEHWTGGGWSSDPSGAAIVLRAGPERWELAQLPSGELVMIFAPGFANELLVRRAPRPEGPWSREQRLITCDLPAEDPEAFCREPQLHLEKMDPLRPDELVVAYDIGTLDGAARATLPPRAYWPRMVWTSGR